MNRVTDVVLAEVSDWQNRALEPVYPIVFLDALRVKIRDAESRQAKSKAVYVVLGVALEGEREVLGQWITANEGAKFWLSIMNNLKNRGLEDILIAVVPSRQICAVNRLPGHGRAQGLPRCHPRGLPGYDDAIRGSARSGLKHATGMFPGRPSPCIVHPLADSALQKAMSREAGAPLAEFLQLERPQGRGQRITHNIFRTFDFDGGSFQTD